jgi:hypothetical protein
VPPHDTPPQPSRGIDSDLDTDPGDTLHGRHDPGDDDGGFRRRAD